MLCSVVLCCRVVMYVYTHVEEKLLYRGERTKFIHTRVRMYIQDSAVCVRI